MIKIQMLVAILICITLAHGGKRGSGKHYTPHTKNKHCKREKRIKRGVRAEDRAYRSRPKMKRQECLDLERVLRVESRPKPFCIVPMPEKTSSQRAAEATKLIGSRTREAQPKLDKVLQAAVRKALDYTLPKRWGKDQFLKIRELGKGACGAVVEFKYTAKDRKGRKGKAPEKHYAIKMVDKTSEVYADEKAACALQIEASPILSVFSDAEKWRDSAKVKDAQVSQLFINTIVKTYDQERDFFFIVMELGDKNDFFDQVTGPLRNNILNEEANMKFYAACMIRALELMHAKNIVHRDIKPENMIINPENGYVQVTDFGFAEISKGKDLTRLCGTPGYIAPEILDLIGAHTKREYGKSVDWWAFGVCLYVMCAGCPAFSDCNPLRLFAKIRAGYGVDQAYWLKRSGVSKEVTDLIKSLLNADLTKRWNTKNKVRDHPWFNDFNWALLDSGRYQAPWRRYQVGDRVEAYWRLGSRPGRRSLTTAEGTIEAIHDLTAKVTIRWDDGILHRYISTDWIVKKL